MKFDDAISQRPAWIDKYQSTIDSSTKIHHKDSTGKPLFINSLILSQSPYLLQHAHNPVDWMYWGNEALSQAQKENKPIFLSIGYATCHWCHVMEQESFENLELAERLNKHFVCIKVDREEHPAIDDYYMTAVQLMTGQGGWPMSSFLTPQGQPFFAGTYFKPTQFAQLLERVTTVWNSEQDKLEEQASRIEQAIYSVMEVNSGTAMMVKQNITDTIAELASIFDDTHGGFSDAPKFPQEVWLMFLLQAYHQKPDAKLLHMLRHSLDTMHRSGICDQLTGSFHRYAVDACWQTPHFEKMLYNQSQMAEVYLQAWQLFGEVKYAKAVVSIIDFVLNEFTAHSGAFYSAFDADSENNHGCTEEGAYYVWSYDELIQLLEPDELHWVTVVYGVSERGNFESLNILHQQLSDIENCKKLQQSPEEYASKRSCIHDKLLLSRSKRKSPLIDNKIITAWNAAMLKVMAIAGRCLNKPHYIESAARCADFLMETHRVKNTASKGESYVKLMRASLGGVVAPITGGLSDYSALSESLLVLYQTTGEPKYFAFAQQLLHTAQEIFKDQESGLMYDFTEDPSGAIAHRFCKLTDSAVLSANARYVNALIGYHSMHLSTGSAADEKLTKAPELLALYAKEVSGKGVSCTGLMRAYLLLQGGPIASDVFAYEGRVRLWLAYASQTQWHLHMKILNDWSIDSEKQSTIRLSNTAEAVTDCCQISIVNDESHNEHNNLNAENIKKGNTLYAIIDVPEIMNESIALYVGLQICNANHCLPLEEARLYIPPSPPSVT